MSIVFFTIPGADKVSFAKDLESKVGDLELVVVNKKKYKTLFEKVILHINNSGFIGTLSDIYYGLILRLNSDLRSRLSYFNGVSTSDSENWPSESFYTNSVNSDEVYEKINEIKPKVIVVWGCGILDKKIFELGQNTVNLHMGDVNHYKGAIGNLQAVLEGNLDQIGATIHFVDENTDTGDIIKIIKGKKCDGPENCLFNLQRKAKEEYLKTISDLKEGREVKRTKQEGEGKINYLKDWTPKKRYQVAKNLIDWERDVCD